MGHRDQESWVELHFRPPNVAKVAGECECGRARIVTVDIHNIPRGAGFLVRPRQEDEFPTCVDFALLCDRNRYHFKTVAYALDVLE